MIYGIGTDIVYIPRILKAYQRFGPKFVNKVLHDSEKQAFMESKSPERFLASRWCSKEALYKAMKTPGLNFNEIIIGHSKTNDFTGIPFPSFVGNTKKVVDPLNLSTIHLSISHDGDYCVAYAIVEKYSLVSSHKQNKTPSHERVTMCRPNEKMTK